MFSNTDLMAQNDRLERFAYKLTRNKADAEDLLQSTFLRAIEKKELFKKDTNLGAWTSKIMYNLFISAYRRKIKFESQYDPEPYLENQKVDAAQESKVVVQEVDDALQKISQDHKDILIMVCVKGMAYNEVAKTLDIPVGTVRSRLSRARDNLQNVMNQNKTVANSNVKHNMKSHYKWEVVA